MKLRNIWSAKAAVLLLAIVFGIAIVVAYQYGPEWGAIMASVSTSSIALLGLFHQWQMAAEQNRPRVIFYVERVGDGIYFRVHNLGSRAAFDVVVDLERPLWFRLGELDWPTVDYHDLRKHVGFLYSPIAFLSPGQHLSSHNYLQPGNGQKLTETVIQRFQHSDPEYNNEGITGTIRYRDQAGREYSEVTKIGFEALRNMKLVTTINRGVPFEFPDLPD